ncbi:MAG: cupin domain-containing protein [Gammaproteobacteria bacterium]|nr:MAG: cupin domain-containing protein [Gammaproteobacteria bacterium]
MKRNTQIRTVRPESSRKGVQGLPCFVGISAQTAGSEGISLSLVEIPPGAVSEPHVHDGYETAIYLLEGEVETRYGEYLEQVVVNRAGDFVYVPPGLPHQARNLSETRPARALVARNDAREMEKVLPYGAPGEDSAEKA